MIILKNYNNSDEFLDFKIYGNFLYKITDFFKVIEKENFKIIYNEKAYNYYTGQSLKSDLENLKDLNKIYEVLKKTIGAYTVLILHESKVKIFQSLYRNIDLFYKIENQNIVISSEIKYLINNPKINLDYCYRYLIGENIFGLDTPFTDVKCIPQGEFLEFESFVLKKREIIGFTEIKNINFVDEISKVIKIFTNNDNNPIYVYFSGGLDSSVILYSSLILNKNVKPVHLLPTEKNSSELDIALKVASEFNRELTVLNHPDCLYSRKSFQPKKVINNINMLNVLDSDFGDVNEINFNILSGNSLPHGLTISGHGGDFIFLQNPPIEIGFDSLKDKGLLKFIKKTGQYSVLKKIRYSEVLYKNFLNFFNKNLRLKVKHTESPKFIESGIIDKHSLLKEISSNTAKYQYIQGILTALYSIKGLNDTKYPILHPMCMQNIIFNIINNPVYEMFNADYDRIVLRSQFFEKSKSNIAWRKTKRSSSGAMFIFFNNNKELVKEYLLNGNVVDFLEIDKDWLYDQININSNISITNDCEFLLKLLNLEVFFKQFIR